MNNYGLTKGDLEEMNHIFKSHPDVQKSLIFGSRAMGTFKRGSDVDLCLQGDHLSMKTVSEIHYQLEEETELPYFFDIVRYDSKLNPELKAHIDRAGIIIYEK